MSERPPKQRPASERPPKGPDDLLPKSIRILLGATGRGIDDARLRDAVEGRIALVTGASSGVGEATARRLGGAGATVLLVARRQELLDKLRDEITEAGGAAHSYPCDIGNPEQVQQLVDDALARHGHVDVIVSNAGISIRRWISQTYARFDDIERTIAINYLGPVKLILSLLPSMRERGAGHIVNVGTVGVDLPPIRWSAYIASKAALETWLKGVAPEIRADGVTTTSVHLQLVRSPMLGPFRMWRYLPGMSTDEAADMIARAIALKPRTIAPVWARVASPVTDVMQVPLERVLARYTRAINPDVRETPKDSSLLGSAADLAQDALGGLITIASMRLIRPIRPDRLARVALAQRRYGATIATLAAAANELNPNRVGIIDELGEQTFSELDARARALAGALHRHFDLKAGQRVAIMCRNHRGFVEASVAIARLGCDLVPLNSDFAPRQLGDVLAREGVVAAVHDEEFNPVFDESGFEGARIVAWHEQEQPHPTLQTLISMNEADAPPPKAAGRMIMLTSGTTGTPKGAHRTISSRAVVPLAAAGLLELARIRPAPRSGEPLVVAPPLFHLYGMIGTMAGLGLGSPIVIRRRFDPEATLADIEQHRAGILLAVPTMLSRIMDLPKETRERYECSSLRMIVSGAAPLSGELARAVMDEFGDVLYNGYASTEVGSGTLATPRDLREAPGTVGKPAAGAKVKILDAEGLELPTGETGRIFVGSPLQFDGYSGGGTKEVIDGLMSTGDVGHFDEHGRLFIDGRDDDMIVSGGENVFPQEVEELIATHEAVLDVAVHGVPDPDFGQRLAAFVVLQPGAKPSVEELKSLVKTHLARHKVPRDVTFVDELPRTSTGKLQRRRLKELQPER